MSIELPNKKISLTLPEQVGKNAKDIDNLKKIIDGLDTVDNVVVVPDISHIMTAAELESVKQPVCFIIYNNHIYLKRNEQSGLAYFDVVFSIIAGTVITFESSEIQVNLSNGALGIVNSTVSTYSQAQIDTLVGAKANVTYVDSQLALKANLSGANFTGAITAPSIIEDMNGYSYTPQTGSFTMSDSYVSACKNGNKLTLVVAGVFTPSTSFSGYIGIGDFTIPQDIGALLVPLSIGGLTYVLDVKSAEMFSSISSSVAVKYRTDKVNNTKLTILLDASNVVANTAYVFRYEVTFLLSGNLAS